MGKLFVILGLVLVVIGLALTYAPWLLNWFGKLPGDINIKTESGQIFVPVTSMIIISILLTVIGNLFFKR
ncbi:MAG: DUF2905 domain-containing protein [Ketobacteraceae bacterium]|nr:DUF2905 domain-containing protein [Ketobacteraceae bacterium]